MKAVHLRTYISSFAAVAVLIAVSGGRLDAEQTKVPSTSQSSVWMVTSGSNRIYLGGAIHLLRESDYPIPQVFERAYKDSTKLVLELKMEDAEKSGGRERMRRLGTFGPSDDLARHIGPKTLRKAAEWAKANNYSMNSMLKLKPWYLSLTMSALRFQDLGAEADRGIEAYFEKRAVEDGKIGEGLETVNFQINLYANLREDQQELKLQQALGEQSGLKEHFEDVLEAWRKGDSEKLQELVFLDGDKYVELTERFILRRNRDWMAPLEAYLKNGERVFALVGAAHLGGSQGLLELFRAKHYTVAQLGAR